MSPKNTQGKKKERKNKESEEEERKGREKSGGQLLVIININFANLLHRRGPYFGSNFLISVYRVGLCPQQLPSNKTGRKQTFPVIFAAVFAIKKCSCVLEMNFDSRNKVVYRDAGSETSRSREFVLRLIFSGSLLLSAG